MSLYFWIALQGIPKINKSISKHGYQHTTFHFRYILDYRPAMIRSLSVTAIGVDMALGGVGHAFVNIL